jgi:cytochrome c peroxidase
MNKGMRRVGIACGALLLSSALGCSKSEKREAPAVTAPATVGVAAAPAAPAAAVATPLVLTSALGKMKVPDTNPATREKAELGHRLFFDVRLSSDGKLACASCHQDVDGTGGHDPIAVGAEGKKLTRHSPIMWNVGYLPAYYWDGRSDSLEAQGKAAWAGGNMGVGEENLQKKADEIGALPEYAKAFDAVFPTEGATPATIIQAIATYERTLICATTAYDKFAAGDASALTAEQKKGWEVFSGKANCNACHTPPFFSDAFLAAKGAYHNTGIGLEGVAPEAVDIGRKKVSSSASDHAAFKTPSLRNVAKSAPYFHNGSVAKLEDAVRFMASGGYKNPNLDANLTDRKLSKEEIQSIVAFLGALTCEEKLTPPAP